MYAPSDSEEEPDWQIGDEVVFGFDARRGFISAVSAHGHLKHQLVRVSAGNGWGGEVELSATDPLLKRAVFHMPTPSTQALDRNFRRRLLEQEADETMEDQEETTKDDGKQQGPVHHVATAEEQQTRTTECGGTGEEKEEEEEDNEIASILS
jgi:hypothetical protein